RCTSRLPRRSSSRCRSGPSPRGLRAARIRSSSTSSRSRTRRLQCMRNRSSSPAEEARMQGKAVRPWYREPWPWILMAEPAAAVVAGAGTVGLAVASYDGLVVEDYYKEGLAVNQRLARVQAAETLGIEGSLVIASADGGPVEARLRAERGALPPAVTLALSHPTRAGLDQQVHLAAA